MRARIKARLGELEDEHGFRIVYANESGSRAWGFASADSDYDVRFIYVWPRERYLGVNLPPETFDFGVDEELLDVTGWDLRKALRLFRKSNASVTEWLHSPIVYREDAVLVGRWRSLTGSVFTPKSSAAHYGGLGKNIWGAIEEGGTTTAKKYLYALRAVLAARFVLERAAPPPVRFVELLDQVALEPELRSEIGGVVGEKSGGLESDEIARSDILDAFIRASLAEIDPGIDVLEARVPPVEELDALFRSALDT